MTKQLETYKQQLALLESRMARLKLNTEKRLANLELEAAKDNTDHDTAFETKGCVDLHSTFRGLTAEYVGAVHHQGAPHDGRGSDGRMDCDAGQGGAAAGPA